MKLYWNDTIICLFTKFGRWPIPFHRAGPSFTVVQNGDWRYLLWLLWQDNFLPFLSKVFVSWHPFHPSHLTRWYRSDWPGLYLFCCYQPLCVVSQQSWFGLFVSYSSQFTPPLPISSHNYILVFPFCFFGSFYYYYYFHSVNSPPSRNRSHPMKPQTAVFWPTPFSLQLTSQTRLYSRELSAAEILTLSGKTTEADKVGGYDRGLSWWIKCLGDGGMLRRC